MHHWVRADSTDFGGTFLPQPRSGHTAVNVRRSKLVIFGGLVDKRFLSDLTVFDSENNLWFNPQCTGNGSDGQVGPSPRAFHLAVVIDCHMFIFGGRSGGKRLGDFWMLDTDIWEWSKLTSYGDLPSPRDFSAASAIGNRKIVMYGGWDGKKWLSDVYVLDTISLEWTELSVSGSLPPPRCGHTATMVEKRLLVFGGRGGGGPIMGDLWALKGLIEEVSVQWRRLTTSNDPPPVRAYHSMTCIGSRYLLFGGFDGKSTFGELWWLVPEDDPIAKRLSTSSQNSLSESKGTSVSSDSLQIDLKESQKKGSTIEELQKKLEISVSHLPQLSIVDEVIDKDFIELSSRLTREFVSSNQHDAQIEVVRDHWIKSTSRSIPLRELGPLLRDYKRLIIRKNLGNAGCDSLSTTYGPCGKGNYRFYHIKTDSQLRMDDIQELLTEYKLLLSK